MTCGPFAVADDVPALFAAAGGRHREGLLEQAESLYRRILAIDPAHLASLHRLGLIAMRQDRFSEAAALYEAAARIDPADAGARYNLGLALKAQGRLEEAVQAYVAAVAADPALAPAHGNLGVALKALGRLAEAVEACRRAAELEPGLAQAWSNLASVLRLTGDAAGAEDAGRRALALDPRHAPALNLLGLMNQDAGRHAQAEAAFRRALRIDPAFAEAAYNLGLALKDRGRREEAKALLRRALALRPDLAEARFALVTAELPPLYETCAEIDERRAAYAKALRELESVPPERLARGVGASQPFYLAYQERDDRDLQTIYGRIVCRAMAAAHAPPEPPPAPGPGEPIRVGLVSGYLRHHANWRLPIRGWLEGLQGPGFRLFGYHTGALVDAQTQTAAALCERFVQGPLSTEQWIAQIAADAPHVLIYPEIGMDPMAARLAALRLARMQCNGWGHPQTSGYRTLDYMLSSDAMEPDDGQAHYAEALVRLPGLSAAYRPLPKPGSAMARSAFGLRETATAYWCGQSLYKYRPGDDALFAAIARGAPDSQFVFLEFPGAPDLTELFRRRLRRSFAAEGLDGERHWLFLPRLSAERFAGALGCCDVVLDSLGWSGCNSLLEALDYDLPIVSCPGDLMRGRHGAALLALMGVTETLAANRADYVSIAVRLGRDTAWRTAVRARVSLAKSVLYGDPEPGIALARFLQTVVYS